jgi:uncharacterized protein YndB with AHSA1/START domain
VSSDRRADRQFQLQIDLQAPRDAVWRALTEAREIERWFAPSASCEPRVGGRLVWRWGEQHTWEHTIEVCEPGQHLRTRYESGVPDGRGGRRPLYVDFRLEGTGGATTLRLVHSGFGPEADFDGELEGISGGWPVELRSLRLYVERHRGQERQLAWAVRSVDLSAPAAWQRLTAPGGLDVAALPRLPEGAAYSVDVPGAGPIRGEALFSPSAREFSGTAANLGDGWFRVHCEHWAGATQVWLWLALYGAPPARVEAFQRAFDALLARRLDGASAVAEPTP